jgi:hypothetical protein
LSGNSASGALRRHAVAIALALAAGIVGLLLAIGFEASFGDESAGPTSATLTDAVNLLYGAIAGVSLTAFAFMFAKPRPTSFGVAGACVLAGYLVVDVPVLMVAGDDAAAGLKLGLLVAPLVALCGAIAGFLGFATRALVSRRRARSDTSAI